MADDSNKPHQDPIGVTAGVEIPPGSGPMTNAGAMARRTCAEAGGEISPMAKLKCPNCGAAAVAGDGGKLRCTNPGCGGTFTFQEGEARLAGVGEFEQLKGKVDQLQISQAELRDLVGSGKAIPPADPPEDPDEGLRPGIDYPDDTADVDDTDEEDW